MQCGATPLLWERVNATVSPNNGRSAHILPELEGDLRDDVQLEDFRRWTYMLVDDCWRQIAAWDHRLGLDPQRSDAELITVVLIDECK